MRAPPLSFPPAHLALCLCLTLSNLLTVLSNGDVSSSELTTTEPTRASYDPGTATNISAQLGTNAFLPCKVRQIGNKSISWIRLHDTHILTVDHFIYIPDERFQPKYKGSTNTWNLQVKYVQPRDAGVYECQLSTEPKTSNFVKLDVVVPTTRIEGELERHVKAGSTVSLRCVISRSLDEPAYIFWYQDTVRVLNQDKHQLEIRMDRVGDNTIGQLTIFNTRRKDSGNYSCAPSNLDAASVILHVLNGEEPAAMQHGNAAWGGEGGRHLVVVSLMAGLTRLLPRRV